MKGLRKKYPWVILLPIIILFACSTNSQIDRGVGYYNQGKYDDALIQWLYPAQQGNHIAQHNMGLLWRDGLGSTPKNLNEAANWFYLSAQQGYPPAMVRLAEVQSMLGNDAPANTWLHLAARWGNAEAIQHLRRKGLTVPQADLQYAQQQQDAQALQALAASMIMLNSLNQMNNTNSGTSQSGSSYSSYQSQSSSTATMVNTAKTCTNDYSSQPAGLFIWER